MTEEEIQEYNTALGLYAGIALPGILGRCSSFDTNEVIASRAFDLAETMMVEFKKRELKKEEECTQE